MVRIAFGIFVVLHGLVHLLYCGHSARLFELQPGLAWPDGSWALARLVANQASRTLASVLLVIAAAGFALGGVGVLVQQAWWRPMVVAAAAFSTVIYVLFWDGTFRDLADKGAVGILINVAILVSVLALQWPRQVVGLKG